MRHKPATAAVLLIATAGLMPAVARADYAVLRSGARLHITGYEKVGDKVRLAIDGGAAEVPADDLVTIEPEDTFEALPPAAVESDGAYVKLIHFAATKHGLDEKLITRVIAVESGFNPKAVSRKHAQGLMQLMPMTAARYSVANVFDPAENIEAGTHYLKDLLVRYSGNLVLALAAYNAGPDLVDRYRGIPPIAETQNYVRLITSRLAARNVQ